MAAIEPVGVVCRAGDAGQRRHHETADHCSHLAILTLRTGCHTTDHASTPLPVKGLNWVSGGPETFYRPVPR
ncbi:MAG: hypothetical protein F4089_07080 [Gammaproteobacteria bacterium]|nr:hypothetical protein [Gammaproteobacteria bacterium]